MAYEHLIHCCLLAMKRHKTNEGNCDEMAVYRWKQDAMHSLSQ